MQKGSTYKDISLEKIAVVLLLQQFPAEVALVSLVLMRAWRGAGREPQVAQLVNAPLGCVDVIRFHCSFDCVCMRV